MIQLHDAPSFEALKDSGLPVLDVRSPGEFAKGHMPGAINLPVFTDAERARVGTAHAQSGPDAAIHVALELVGGQLAEKLERARFLTHHRREALVYCWRGGMRSGSMSWLLETGGFTVHKLQGGYKAFRAHVRKTLARPATVLVLGGMTGSGKTDMLLELRALGSQVIDLEGLAGHRGSAFGGVGLGEQPGNEEVETAVYEQWRALDLSRPVWVEDEGRRIGTVTLGKEFFGQLESGRLVLVDVPRAPRVERLVRMYTGQVSGNATDEALVEAAGRLEARLGNAVCRSCVAAVRAGDYAQAVTLVLDYYDKTYSYQISRRTERVAHRLSLDSDDPRHAAKLLQDYEQKFFGKALPPQAPPQGA